MIGYRHADPRFPFLWESTDQPPARWHGPGAGPAHYLATTPDAAWAEFLRHEEITDPRDVETVQRAMWAIEVPQPPEARPRLPLDVLLGGTDSYPACQAEAARLRARGVTGILALSAAVDRASRSGFRTDGGLRLGDRRREMVIVLFGPQPQLIGWAACAEGRPRGDLLARVRPFRGEP